MDVQFSKLRDYIDSNEQLSKIQEYATAYEPESLAWQFFGAVRLLYIVYWTGVGIYRLTLHPLADVPGPFLCKITRWQQTYYEAFLNSKFIDEIPGYHRKYGMLTLFPLIINFIVIVHLGPIVRINPNEVHIDDHTVFHE